MSRSSTTIELQAADWRLCVNPVLGGSVIGLWLGTTPILRNAPEDASHVDQCAAYPLLPYSNRIGNGQLSWRRQDFHLRNGFSDEPHGLHGVGFMRAWDTVTQSQTHLRLRLQHQPDAYWPFAFSAEQEFELSPAGLRVVLRLRNTDRRAQPMGLGWHPFFVRRAESTFDVPVHTRWPSGKDKLPLAPCAVKGVRGAVADMRLDDCCEGRHHAVAVLSDAILRVTLQADSRYWVIYTPRDAPFYCVEPVTHLSNAVQQPDPLQHGVAEVPPEGGLSLQVVLKAQRVA